MKIKKFYTQSDSTENQPWPTPHTDRDLVLYFSNSQDQNTNLWQRLRKDYPNSEIIGCSGAGCIFDNQILDQHTSLTFLSFENTNFFTQRVDFEPNEPSFHVGEKLGQRFKNTNDLSCVLIFSEGLQVNGSELVQGLQSKIPESCPIIGGLAGDDDRFESTWVVNNDGFSHSGVLAVGLYGNHLQCGTGSYGGWDIFGPERVITKSEKNILYEIDNIPALELYKKYLGEISKSLPASALRFPLQIRLNKDSEHSQVRTILGIDEDTKSLRFAGNVPQGHLAQLMKSNRDRLIEGSLKSALSARNAATEIKGDSLSLAISCVGRRLVLREHAEEETEITMQQMPSSAQQIGFYSYGEIGPHRPGGISQLHNQTMTIAVIGEKKSA